MKQIKKKTYQWYLLYAILLTVCLFYFCFPSNAIKDYLIKTVRGINPQVLVSVEDVRPSLMLGLKLLNAKFSQTNRPDMDFFSAEIMTIRPEILSFLSGEPRYKFYCQSYRGKIKGIFQIKEKKQVRPFNTSFKLNDIHIDDWKWLKNLSSRNSRGILNGTIKLEGQSNLLVHGSGEANLKILNGSLALKQPFLDLESINFDELQVKLMLKGRKLELSHFKMKGQEIQGTLSGVITLDRNFQKSRLNLDGNVELLIASFMSNNGKSDEKAFLQKPLKFPIIINGTIEQPAFKFS